ncbi:terpene synthase family protein [Streptomyces sp. NPDC048417]
MLARRAAGEVACAVNDLVSLEKDVAAGERHNLVLVRV